MFGIKGKADKVTGDWEERGVIGTRIEIDKKKVVILWRSAPVLESKYSIEEQDGKLILKLENNGLRYMGSAKDYATVTELYLLDGKLHLHEHFPISGPSETVMTRTENNRYGDYDVVTSEYLPQLRGTWKDENGYYEIVFSGSTMLCRGEKTEICVLRSRSDGRLKIADADPGKRDAIGDFVQMDFFEGMIQAHLLVCDAPSVTFTLKKV